MRKGQTTEIHVSITPPPNGTAIRRVSVYPKSALAAGATVIGTSGLQFLPGLNVQLQTVGTDVWMAQIETVEGCLDTTAATGPSARTFQVTP